MVGQKRKFFTLDRLKEPYKTFFLPFYLTGQHQIVSYTRRVEELD